MAKKNNEEDFVGYIKLTGNGVKEGFIDAASASELLDGVDKSLRFFITQEDIRYAKFKYQLPVKIEPGSLWIYLTGLVITGAATVAVAYASSAAKKIAENDIGDKNSSEIFSAAAGKLKTVVKIAKHRGKLGKQTIDNPKFKDNNQIIGLPNSRGEYLYVKKSEFDAFIATPAKLYEPMAKNVDENTELTIGIKDEDGKVQEERIDNSYKSIFSTADETEENEIILPELVDGMYVELEGEVTRGNERTNTMGFEHKGHILTCDPEEGSITQYKDELFGKAIIKGRISRNYKDSARADESKKPRIIFDKLIKIKNDGSQIKLL